MELDIILVSLTLRSWNVWELIHWLVFSVLVCLRVSMRLVTSLKKQRMHGALWSCDCGHILILVLSIIASKGIVSSALATGILGFATTILFLFCIPELDTFLSLSLSAPQPFVLVYAFALGKNASIFMTVIAVLGLILVTLFRFSSFPVTLIYDFQNTSICIVASSRLVFAVARDGVLPFSKWIGQVDSSRQPKNAVVVIYVFAALILCTILPSQVAFFSLVSAGAVPTVAAYGLIALLRLTITPNNFKSSFFFLGRFRRIFYFAGVLWNALIVAVSLAP